MIALYNMTDGLTNAITGMSGTLHNQASIVTDAEHGRVLYLNNPVGHVAQLAGGYESNGQWASLSAPHIPDSDSMTISIWFKQRTLRTWARIVDLGDTRAQSTEANSPLRFISITPYDGNHQFQGIIACFDINDNRDRSTAPTPELNEWTHAVFVIDASRPLPTATLYVNGIASTATQMFGHSPKDILSAPFGLGNGMLGRSRWENNGDHIFDGWISDVAIFDVALTPAQIAALASTDLSSYR
jgi:hypothetical protein